MGTFGQFLRDMRKNAGATQEALAVFCNRTKQYISDIEKGRNKPPNDPELLFKISHFFKLKGNEKEKFEDYAAKARGDIASDIKEILNNNPKELTRLRKQYGKK